MNDKIKRIIYKLYLSLQAIVGLIGVGTFLWMVICIVHDSYIDSEARDCIAKIMEKEEISKYPKASGQKYAWLELVEEYHFRKTQDGDKPWLHYQYLDFKESIDKQCSEYVDTYYSDYDKKVHLYLNGWYDRGVPDIADRMKAMGITLLVSFGFLGLFFALRKWIAWIFK